MTIRRQKQVSYSYSTLPFFIFFDNWSAQTSKKDYEYRIKMLDILSGLNQPAYFQDLLKIPAIPLFLEVMQGGD
jgi:hypothetical protein